MTANAPIPLAARAARASAAGLLALVVGCGGGGHSGTSGTGQTWVPGVYAPWSALAGSCAAPRSGTDPVTGVTYPDKKGTLLDEELWIRSWTNDLYLWYAEVPDPNPSLYATAPAYFDTQKTSALTATGAARDRFHFTYPTAVWEAMAFTGVQAGYGAAFEVLQPLPPRLVVVAYADAGSPAANATPPVARGAQVLTVDGVDLVNDPTRAGVDTLNAGLFPTAAGESHTFGIRDFGAAASRQVTLVSAAWSSSPVQHVGTISTGSGTIGYMLFNDHLASAEQALIDAVGQLQAAGITDLVVDMRYNGGGYLGIASELAYMIAGPAATSGRMFEETRFNAKHPTIDPVTGTAIGPVPFLSTAQGYSAARGTPLPHLDLARLLVLTGRGTCSASESVLNGLRGIGFPVHQFGSVTCGKPYGFYPFDNCGTTYFSIQFQGVNAVGFGDYPDGFWPENDPGAVAGGAATLPGCSVGDDLGHALGDAAEARLAAALAYLGGAPCPAPTGVSRPQLLSRAALGQALGERRPPLRLLSP